MYINKIRLGFATNSSSSHSIVIVPSGTIVPPDRYTPGEFGWEDFVLASTDAKLNYLAAQVYTTLQENLAPEVASAVVKDLFGSVNRSGYVDHRSVFSLPHARQEEYYDLDRAFLKDLTKWIKRNNVVILGGSDQTDEDDPDSSSEPSFPYKTLGVPFKELPQSRHLVARKDKNYWVLFNTKTGAKIRFSFLENPPPYEKPTAPELVDLKITNYCPFECRYCYQDSHKKGQHASIENVNEIIYTLGLRGVFEVAIGGGEPTMHPDFIDILRACRNNSIVPSFSTKSLHWLRDDKQAREILDLIGGFAYSIETPVQIQDLAALLITKGTNIAHFEWEFHMEESRKVFLQYILNEDDHHTFECILEEAKHFNLPLTLLGKKYVGRAAQNIRTSQSKRWLQTIKRMEDCPPISIDTALAQRYELELKETKISDLTYETEEGKFSMYIDAVNMKMGPSSYCSKSDMSSFGRNWLSKFKAY